MRIIFFFIFFYFLSFDICFACNPCDPAYGIHNYHPDATISTFCLSTPEASAAAAIAACAADKGAGCSAMTSFNGLPVVLYLDSVYHYYFVCGNCSDCSCPVGCDNTCKISDSECGSNGYSVLKGLDGQCTGKCNISPSCAQAYEAKCIACGSCDNIRNWDDQSCSGTCVGCVDQMDNADKTCPFGYSMTQDTCEFHCKSCEDLLGECQATCAQGKNPIASCSSTNGVVTDFLCDCDKPNNCSSFYDACAKSCSSPGCDGVKSKQCQEDNGQVVYSKCECNSCSSDPDPRDPHDPSPNPSDDSDSAGWLKAIKQNTDTLVSQADDQSGWLEQIDSNTDDVENLLGIIAKKEVDTSGIVSAQNSTTSAVNDLKSGLSGAQITSSVEGVETLGTTGDITGDSYVINSTPADGALPSSSDIDTAFGDAPTESEDQTSYRTDVTDALNDITPPFSSPVCTMTFTVPNSMPFIGGKTYPLDFCPYADGLALVGNILIFLAALRELYLFS